MSSWFRPRVLCSRSVILEQLEERIVLDAAVDASAQENNDQSQTETPQGADGGDAPPVEASGAPETQSDQTSDPVGEIFNQDLSVVLISNALDQVGTLENAVVDEAEVIVYDGESGDLSCVTDALHDLVEATGQEIGHLAILSHGAPGILSLGGHELWTVSALETDPAGWSALGGLLSDDARIDLYGCSIAAGEEGFLFVSALSEITSATVWASDDATGNVEGADWVLEIRTSGDDRSALIDASSVEGVPIELDTIANPAGQTVDNLEGTDDGDDITNDGTVRYVINGKGGSDTIYVNGPVGTDAATDGVYGGAGDDTVYWNGGAVTGNIDGGSDTDALYLNVLDGVTDIYYDGTPSAGTLTYDGATVKWRKFESVYLTGNDNNNTIHIAENSEVDQVDAGDGNDDIRIRAWVDSPVSGNIDGGAGTDDIQIYGDGNFTGNIDGGANRDYITISDGVRVTGDILGGGGNDEINNDGLVLGDIFGGTDKDHICSSSAVDGNIYGGADDDTIELTDTGLYVSVVYGDGGTDRLIVTYDQDVEIIGNGTGVAGHHTADWTRYSSTYTHKWEGFETVDIRGSNADNAITILGGTAVSNISAANGNDDIRIYAEESDPVSGNIDGGAGTDDIRIYGPGDFTGNIDGGANRDYITIFDSVHVTGDILGGGGNDEINNLGLVLGDIFGGADKDHICSSYDVYGNIYGGADDDTIELTDTGQYVSVVYGDGGTDRLIVTYDEDVDINGDGTGVAGHHTADWTRYSSTYTHEWEGFETVDIGGSNADNAITIGYDATVSNISAATGNDTITLNCGVVTGQIDGGNHTDILDLRMPDGVSDIDYDGTPSTATLTYDGATVTWKNFESVYLTGNANNNTIDLTAGSQVNQVDAGAGDDEVTVFQGTVIGVIEGGDGTGDILTATYYDPDVVIDGTPAAGTATYSGTNSSNSPDEWVHFEEFRCNPPAAEDDDFTTDEDTPFTTGNVLDNDSDPDDQAISLKSFDTTDTIGAVSDNGDGTFDYDPAGNFDYLAVGEEATDTFTYTIEDSDGYQDTATVTITVQGAKDPMDAQDFTQTGGEDTVFVVEGWAWEDKDDPDDTPEHVGVTVLPHDGVLFEDLNNNDAVDPGEEVQTLDTADNTTWISWDDATTNRLVKFKPDPNWFGATELEYRVRDDHSDWGSTGTATIGVNNTPEPGNNTPFHNDNDSFLDNGPESFAGPLGTAGVTPDTGRLIGLLSGQGLLPGPLAGGQGDLTEHHLNARSEFVGLLAEALFREDSEAQKAAWDNLFAFVSGNTEVFLGLEEFLDTLKEWQVGKPLDDTLLVFNADEIKLAEWFHSLMAAGDNVLGNSQEASWEANEYSQLSSFTKSVVFDMNDMRVQDLLLVGFAGHRLAASHEPQAAASSAACRVFDPGAISFMKALVC